MAASDVAIRVDGDENANAQLRRRKTGDLENPRSLVVANGGPPVDDCCPICFGAFTVPCRTSCGHWFCANCILMFWNYSNALKRCKCPICSSYINKLALEASQIHKEEEDVVEARKKVQKYNNLFVGGVRGIIMRAHQLPLLSKRLLAGLMDPERYIFNYLMIRLFSLFIKVIQLFNFHILPAVYLQIIELSAMAVFVVVSLIGFHRRPRQLHPRIQRFMAERLPWLF